MSELVDVIVARATGFVPEFVPAARKDLESLGDGVEAVVETWGQKIVDRIAVCEGRILDRLDRLEVVSKRASEAE